MARLFTVLIIFQEGAILLCLFLSAQEVDQLIEWWIHPFSTFYHVGVGPASTTPDTEAVTLEGLDVVLTVKELSVYVK